MVVIINFQFSSISYAPIQHFKKKEQLNYFISERNSINSNLGPECVHSL